MAGQLPIEQIEPGMMVWSAPENGSGEACFRPVLETYRNRAPAVWHVSYDHDADSATPDETLGASAEHPFWVEETASFLPAADLRPGMTLRMAGGHGGTIGTIRHEPSHSPAGTPVFNFAVAEHHTYFAGIGGVWVHNLCSEALKRYGAKFDSIYKNRISRGMSQSDAWDEALRQVIDKVIIDVDKLGRTDAFSDLADTAAKLLSELGGRISNAVLSERWKRLIYATTKSLKHAGADLKMPGGNAFNHLRAAYCRSKGGFSEVLLSNGRRLDAYIPGKEIVSRKWKQYSNNGRDDFANDLDEMIKKYATPTPQKMKSGGIANDKVKDSETADLIRRTINEEVTGTPILEITIQEIPIPADWLHEARVRGIMVRDVAGNIIQDVIYQ